MKVRSGYFALTGALGGLVGFLLMELTRAHTGSGGGRAGDIISLGLQFTGFGLAVGAALGMTEGWVTGDRRRLVYGLILGIVLGAAGGFVGGGVGQLIFGLVPLRYAGTSNADIAVSLDSSGSMSELLFFGNDPWGRRKKATKRLIDRLSPSDRVAIVDFDDEGRLLFPLAPLDSPAAHRTAKEAVDRIDARGGTNLDAGLLVAIEELERAAVGGRDQHVIFLTDGAGTYHPETAQRARRLGIRIHTVGLGDGVDAALLSSIAEQTGGHYYSVGDASDLIAVFDAIFVENVDMASTGSDASPQAELVSSPALLLLVRILSWAVMGLAIGAGQGVRENSREDLRACSLGGLLGGAVGGALFIPVSGWVGLGAGLVGRALGDVIVGGCIGGSMRLAQQQLVEASGKPTTTLIGILPEKRGLALR